MRGAKLSIVAALMTLVPLFSNAAQTPAKCVEREDQIQDVAKIKNFVAKMGGMRAIEGDWKLGGLAGSFKRVIVSFESANDGLKAKIDGMDDVTPTWGAIKICDTVRADTLFVQVIKTKDAIYIREGSKGSMQLAEIKDGKVGTFYSFYKQ
ncbi:hypothetical protein AZI86_08810 [Bdellovibrio bacteriovorus]|uniref:Uncharacterized protein n=1 Tax=Bdellovibrio bacteriovorus TaxID=959 RepID=A0A150WRL2_BDEBC|nr:hypothetical protein [Bdellovibrio bacteriovorus]KYG67102.1 hypothetical protein AZI86_08810 [Bdellovibrio bacteriovorus]